MLKRVAWWRFRVDLRLTRAIRRARGERPYRLGGDCRRCARCCEAPAIQVAKVVFHLRTLRGPFLWWQRTVNGFELEDEHPRESLFVFRCTHFDPATRSCDSYDSRPGMCRDYPRLLMWQPSPEMLPGCGYKPVDPRAERLLRELDVRPLTPEQRERLRKGLHLDDS
jgi:Fe-S-cluster containining protein